MAWCLHALSLYGYAAMPVQPNYPPPQAAMPMPLQPKHPPPWRLLQELTSSMEGVAPGTGLLAYLLADGQAVAASMEGAAAAASPDDAVLTPKDDEGCSDTEDALVTAVKQQVQAQLKTS